MEEKNSQNHPLFGDLIDIGEWQKIQDNFSLVTNVPIRTLDIAGIALTKTSQEPRLCSENLKNPVFKKEACDCCLPTFLGGKAVVNRNLSFGCPLGTTNFITPLRLDDGEVLAYVIMGPVVLVMSKFKEEYRKLADQFNLDLEELWSAISEINVMSFHAAESMVELIRNVGEYILKSTYKNLVKPQETAIPDPGKLKRLLQVFLDVAFQVSGADIGSIMLTDKSTGELTIRASKGLTSEIVSNSRVRLGDGICGTVAKERKSLLIDENFRDNRIRRYLSRPYIKSSMVLPINLQDDVIGVVNLASLQSSPVSFDPADLALMGRLIELATIALR